ncbi:hypothetical protein Aab01nite_75870 [Paractinoplanes abujensis]|uniref:Energy-coupling factor transporter ATP-binding protein EcfA2 n=1 Tax=Paractinoplanes abujensis TaxID=882441 RepID=A0A7W7G4G6_9ACTN|nr:hypothetical protein [Actinoplanes abujensis]MBB4695260.1 energy-coupling factor transporter ATP-binding protein EcfA2 [Actinoplanes abujensis]GID23997.1 hypothetical protein Aab01nite_75870 [Actinoplanes abujensis]
MLRPSSRRGLTYADAVHFLGAGESKFLSYVGRLAGIPAGAAALATLSSVDLLAARNEIVEWGQSAFRSFVERRAGLSRFDRTERLVAAHTVLVVNAFFECWGDTGITASEQAALAARSTSESTPAQVAEVLAKATVPMPSAAVPPEKLRADLETYYLMLAAASARFLEGLSFPPPHHPDKAAVVEAAIRQYEITYRSLAADVPEFAIWAAMTDAAAGRATTERVGGELATGLADIRAMVAGLTGAAAACRADLADQYRRELGRPIVDVGDLPDGVTLPATADLYVNPRARAGRAEQGSPVAAESWWAEAAEVPEIQAFLAGYLTGWDAVAAPLVVLGQPGSGKSMLTRVLAATLPPSEYLAVRVELRSVAADAPLQDQIEAAVYDTIGERVPWPELVRSAGGALPVVLLDGFDELLQASGANRADYLEQVRDFQRREADRGRPVAVLVTSRIVVADRARVPDGSVVLRLDPFDDKQIETWLSVWRATNQGGLTTPLPVEVALRYRELAEQPLLLLMLALYDARNNDLREGGDLNRTDLYERLFAEFAHRELAKREPSAPIDAAAIARELRRLEYVAMALFVRGAQVVTEHELENDLRELLRNDRVDRPDRARSLSATQLLVGRFFFLHESRAREGVDQPERCFEFLHATFGEFLVARLVVTTLTDLAEEGKHQARRPYPGPLDAGPLYAWLSFAVLTGRRSVIEFCGAMIGRLSPELRDACDSLLRELLRGAAFPPSTWSLGGYQPLRRSASGREAAFTANLTTLIVLVSPSEGVDPESLGVSWRAQALLWESQLSGDAWQSLWTTMRLVHSRSPDERATLALDDGSSVSLWQSVPYRSDASAESIRPEPIFRDVTAEPGTYLGGSLRMAAFRADIGLPKVLAHSAAPFLRLAPLMTIHDAASAGTNLEVIMEVLFASRDDGPEARHLSNTYQAALSSGIDAESAVVMRLLEGDAHRIEPRTVLNVLLEAAQQTNAFSRSYMTEFADGPARILAICHRRNSDPELIRAVYDRIGGHTKVNPGQQRFRDLLRQEFEILGVPFPEELFA